MIKSNKTDDGIFIKVNREIKIFGKKRKPKDEDWLILIYNITKPP